MGQYFKAVNLDKRELVCPWCIGGGAKLWEWAANAYGAIFTLLLRKSSATGGGDYYNPLRTGERMVQLDTSTPERAQASFDAAIRKAAAIEGQPIVSDPDTIVGRWAGDRVALIGDYDESKLWKELPDFRNISREVVQTWNDFIELDDHKLSYNTECSCQQAS